MKKSTRVTQSPVPTDGQVKKPINAPRALTQKELTQVSGGSNPIYKGNAGTNPLY